MIAAAENYPQTHKDYNEVRLNPDAMYGQLAFLKLFLSKYASPVSNSRKTVLYVLNY